MVSNSPQDSFSLFITIPTFLVNVWLSAFRSNSWLHFSISPCISSRQNWNLGGEIAAKSWQNVLFLFAGLEGFVCVFSFLYLLLIIFSGVPFQLTGIGWIPNTFSCNLLVIWETLSCCNLFCSCLGVCLLVGSRGDLDFVE